jgi:hypothetical protein
MGAMRASRPTVLPFVDPATLGNQTVGRVHADGSITFRGRTYPTVREVPEDCLGLRADAQAYAEWRRLYRAIAPRPRREPSTSPRPRREP